MSDPNGPQPEEYSVGGILPPGATIAVNDTGEAEPVGPPPPWPVVSECHGHTDGQDCPQCDGSHEHRWKAWPDAPDVIKAGPGVPVRCITCGGRKCDMPACRLRRHHFGEDHDLY